MKSPKLITHKNPDLGARCTLFAPTSESRSHHRWYGADRPSGTWVQSFAIFATAWRTLR